MVWEVVRDWSLIQPAYGAPGFRFHYEGFSWVNPLPGDAIYLPFAVAGAASFCVAIGLWYRAAAVLAWASYSYWFLLEQANYLNHFYLVCLLSFTFVFMNANRWASLDAWRARGKLPDTVPFWQVALIRAQIVLVYIFGAVAKMNADWIAGQPLVKWLGTRTGVPLLEYDWVKVHVFAHGGLLFDLLIGPLLLWRRTRVFALIPLVAFHLTNAHVFNIGIFPWLMLAVTVIFFSPGSPRRVWTRLRRRLGHSGSPPELRVAPPAPRAVVVASTAFVVGWLSLQVLVPLRHFAYVDNVVHWTEEGHRFAWHMKLRSKRGWGGFEVYDRATGESRLVNPGQLLHPRQVSKMLTRPHMIHEFAQYLGERARADGVASPEVYAYVWASLNGRPYQPLVDPNVDLLQAEYPVVSAARWIVPLNQAAQAGLYPEFDQQIAEWTIERAKLARK